MWHIYTMDYYSDIKKNKMMLFAAIWTELETLILSELSQKEKDVYHMIWHIWNQIYGTSEPTYRKQTSLWTWRTDLWLPKGSGKQRDGLGV